MKQSLLIRALFQPLCVILAAFLSSFWSSAAPSSAKWEKDIAAFEAEDRATPPPTNAVLFVGSSSIRMWTNLAEMFPGKTTIRRGFGGSHLYDVNAYFDRLVLRYRPAKIVLYAGENDISDGRSPRELFEDFKTLAVKVHTALPRTKVYYLAAKFSPSRWHYSPQVKEANALIRAYARFRSQVEFVDVAEPLLDAHGRPNGAYFGKDNLHLNDRGYALWARKIEQALED